MSVIGHSPLAGASGAAGGGDPLYVDDVFSTFLYTASGSTQTITNGIDLAGEGGMVWIKNRANGGSYTNNTVVDSERIGSNGHESLYPNLTEPEFNPTSTSNAVVTSFSSNGFTRGGNLNVSNSSGNYATWTFRKAPGFFDVVTYSGTGSAQNIAHSLGSVPGMILIHCRDGYHDWEVYHRSTGATKSFHLNKQDAAATDSTVWNNTTPTSSVFTVGTSSNVNQNGHGYVAYVFAHDEQSFGTDSDEAIIKCGSYTGTGTSGNVVNVGFEPQFLLIRQTNASRNWYLADNMRGIASGQYTAYLQPNISNAETDGAGNTIDLHATGFELKNHSQLVNDNSGPYIYMAIRRPHKPPTAGTEVFSIAAASSYQAPVDIPCNFAPDFFIAKSRTNAYGNYAEARLTDRWMQTNSTSSEDSNDYFHWDGPGGKTHLPSVDFNDNPIYWQFRRAPGFFDVVTYTGTGSARTVNHNLGVTPELMICKPRSTNNDWVVYNQADGASKVLYVNLNLAAQTSTDRWNNTAPTSTVFTVGTAGATNSSGVTFVNYLFASLDAVSKVGTYSGTGSSFNVDCGFTAGARFVLIKRTNSSGDWYLFDSVRGITNGDDPYILLNSGNAQVDGFNPISPLNSGFSVNSAATAGELNDNSGTYLFLAIA